ncbi:MAG: Secretion system C-terminal sorting domain, partial [Bacteroidota bacterium]
NSALIAAPHSSAIDMLTPGAMFKGLKSDAKSTAGKKDMQLMSVFPNPVSNQLQLYFAVNKNDKVQLAIIAADGKTLYSKAIKLQPGKSSTTLDVSGFLKGTYFARALFEDGQITSIKFIK